MSRSRLVFIAVLLASAASIALGRTWTDNQGNQIKARFVRVHQGKVVLSMGRRVITVPFANFSLDDQDYIRQQLKAKGQEHLVPPASRTDGSLPGLKQAGPAGDDEGPAGMGGEPTYMPGAGPPSSFPGPGGFRPPGMPEFPPPAMPKYGPENMPGYGPGREGPGPPPGLGGPRDGYPSSGPMYGGPGDEYATEPEEPDYGAPPAGLGGPPDFGPPTIPDLRVPVPSLPSGGSSEFSSESDYYCSNCEKDVPAHLGAGDRCPHCGVYWDYEETADGRTLDASGREASRAWIGAVGGAVAGGLGALIYFLVKLAARRE